MSPIVKLFLILFLISTVEVIFTAYMKSPKRLGRVFEREIASALKSLNHGGIYGRVLRNIYLPKNEYETSEIDILYITTKGIFIIECKNYKGWIFGDEGSNKWTISLPRGKGRSRKYHFFNPIKQNLSHIKPLQDYLNSQFPDKTINTYPLVVFSRRGTMKKVSVSSDTVFYKEAMIKNIKTIIDRNNPILTQVQVDELFESMMPLTKVDKSVKKQHIENIRNKYGYK